MFILLLQIWICKQTIATTLNNVLNSSNEQSFQDAQNVSM